jgi:Ala-tRNA(Pro) deacylase
MTWEQLSNLAATPYFTIQCHAFWHPNFKQDSKRLDRTAYAAFVDRRPWRSKAILEDEVFQTHGRGAWNGAGIALLPFGRPIMSTMQNSLNYLDSHGIQYAHTTHSLAYTAEQVARAEHMPPHRMAKTVVCRDGDGYVMAVVPADSHVDLEQLRTAIGVSVLYLAEETELCLLFPDAAVGSMPPLGPLFNLRVYVDRQVANQEFIAFNAGTHRDVIHMRVADFRRLVKPVIGDFCQPNYRMTGSFA